ncbi:hypothetical protein GCM10023264_05900 [Sphingomonas daechungensis]|uniref:hypothetical protein n=1 Tax=Sphingomonas daechungensis TaxID=1176646 RepID=UPI0031EFBEDD
MSATMDARKMRVMIWRMLAGAIVGAVASLLFFKFVGEPNMDLKNPSVLIAAACGIVYLLIGLMVALGVAAPKTGAHFLNVEDADELREERPKLRTSAIATILIGVFVLVLAMAGGGIDNQVALAIAALCLIAVVAVTAAGVKQYDELTWQLTREASAYGFYATLVLFGGWAALAHLGYVPWISPLAFVSLLIILQLLTAFIAVGRRGMLMPR